MGGSGGETSIYIYIYICRERARDSGGTVLKFLQASGREWGKLKKVLVALDIDADLDTFDQTELAIMKSPEVPSSWGGLYIYIYIYIYTYIIY